MKTDLYRYSPVPGSYVVRPVPNYPEMQEHLFYVRAKDIPLHVPSGCNPRESNIDKPVYRKVMESFRDTEDMTFHLKNKGITVLVDEVVKTFDGTSLTARIPEALGNVDGNHSYNIVVTCMEENPDQMVAVRILEGLPAELISPVAAGLNTAVQVTNATMADHYKLFAPVQSVLEPYEYAQWIGYRQNASNTSATSKDLVSFMWVCHPQIFDDHPNWDPNWVFTRATLVYDKFYNEKNEEFRKLLLEMSSVTPDLIDIFREINESVTDFIPKNRRRNRTANADANNDKGYEVSVSDLCVISKGRPFRDPSDHSKSTQLRECYRLILISGLRALLQINPEGYAEWKVPYPTVKEIIQVALRKIYPQLVRQLRQSKRDHNHTSRQSAVWGIPLSHFTSVFFEGGYSRLKAPKKKPPFSPHVSPRPVTAEDQREFDFVNSLEQEE